MNSILRRFDLSSNLNFVVAWLACVGACVLISFLTVNVSFSYYTPNLFDKNYLIIIQNSMASALLVSAPSTFIFLILIRRMNFLNRKLGYKLRHDDLTGILSREAFMTDFGMNRDENTESRQDALLVIDADYFKQINDTYGHSVGDKALVKISNALYKSVRGTDKVGRIGGEEFAIHLNNVSMDLAELIADRIRLNVKEAAMEFDIPDLELSVSIGLVSYKDNRNLQDLMLIADKLLYKAKESGRNCVQSTFLKPEQTAA